MPLFRRKLSKKRVIRRPTRRKVARVVSPLMRARREAARQVILARVAYWSELMGIRPNRIAIRDQRSRWGSASSLGNLNFNWRIAGMPEPIHDYVIIHELAHLVEMNHSPAFWAIVGRYSPDYRLHRKWLRALTPAGRAEL